MRGARRLARVGLLQANSRSDRRRFGALPAMGLEASDPAEAPGQFRGTCQPLPSLVDGHSLLELEDPVFSPCRRDQSDTPGALAPEDQADPLDVIFRPVLKRRAG